MKIYVMGIRSIRDTPFKYVSLSHFSHSLPLHKVKEGDTTEDEPWGITIPDDENSTIILPETSYLSFVASSTILQRSSSPVLAANLSLDGVLGGGAALGVNGGNISVDTTPPEVDEGLGVEVWGASNETYFAGEEVYVRVW